MVMRHKHHTLSVATLRLSVPSVGSRALAAGTDATLVNESAYSQQQMREGMDSRKREPRGQGKMGDGGRLHSGTFCMVQKGTSVACGGDCSTLRARGRAILAML